MLNPSLTEESLVRAIRDAEIPAPPKDAVARLSSAQVRQPRRFVWMLPATAGGAAAFVLGALLLSHPTHSWADVVSKASGQTHYTLTLTRLMNGGKERVSDYYYRDGDLWRRFNTYGLKDKTITVRHYPGIMNYVTIDRRKDPPKVNFAIEKILRQGVKPTVQRSVKWHGRTVDIFRLKDTYRDKTTQTFEQEVIVDPQTALPIEVTLLRDNKQWGDIWDYDFRRPDSKVFIPHIDKDAKVFDLVKQRAELTALLSKNPDALFITGEEGIETLMLIKGDPKAGYRGAKIHMNLENHPGDYRGVQLPYRWRGDGPNNISTIHIGGYDWREIKLYSGQLDSPTLQFKAAEKNVNGSINVGEERVSFKNAQIYHTGDVNALLRSFGEEESATP